MKRGLKRKTSAVVLAAVLMSLGYDALPGPVSANGDEEKAVLGVLQRQAVLIESGDLEALDELWSHDGSVLIFESGGVDKGWESYRDHHLGPELKAFKNMKFKVSNARTKVDGNTAWATYEYSLSADYKDRKIASSGLGTMIFEKIDGKWLIVHSHTSATRKRKG